MSKRFYQSGDFDNTIYRKLLENQTQFPASAPFFTPATTEGVPVRYAAIGDDDNTLLRKLLENQAASTL